MGQKISLIILTRGGSRVRRLSVPVSLLIFLGVAMLCNLGALGFFLSGAALGHRSAETLQQKTALIAQQRHEIAEQRMQIEFFDNEVSALKERILRLHQFEAQFRTLARLEPPPSIQTVFDATETPGESASPVVRDMNAHVRALDVVSEDKQRRFEALRTELEGKQNLLTATPAIRPTEGWITSRYGTRISPFTDQEELHQGLDIANRVGTEVVATGDGVVSFVGSKGSMGKLMVIDHGYGMVTRYAHLNEPLKKSGDKVKRGDIIAYMGSSGRSTGPHLHYEVELNGVLVDPVAYIMNWSFFEPLSGEGGTISAPSPLPETPKE